MEKIPRHMFEMMQKDELIEFTVKLQDLFFQAKDALEMIKTKAEELPHRL